MKCLAEEPCWWPLNFVSLPFVRFWDTIDVACLFAHRYCLRKESVENDIAASIVTLESHKVSEGLESDVMNDNAAPYASPELLVGTVKKSSSLKAPTTEVMFFKQSLRSASSQLREGGSLSTGTCARGGREDPSLWADLRVKT